MGRGDGGSTGGDGGSTGKALGKDKGTAKKDKAKAKANESANILASVGSQMLMVHPCRIHMRLREPVSLQSCLCTLCAGRQQAVEVLAPVGRDRLGDTSLFAQLPGVEECNSVRPCECSSIVHPVLQWPR